jgi:hypothetical protein
MLLETNKNQQSYSSEECLAISGAGINNRFDWI